MTQDRDTRLEELFARERAARIEAEQLAERTTRELYDRQQELALLAAVATAANRARTAEQALEHLLPALCVHLDCPISLAWLPEQAGGGLRCAAAHHTGAQDTHREYVRGIRHRRFASGEGLPGKVLSTGGALCLDDVRDEIDLTADTLPRRLGLGGAIAFPVIVGGAVLAVIECVADDPIDFTPQVLALSACVCEMLAQVFERDRVEQGLRHEAYHDAVTGLPNRVLFRERLTHALSLARRTELGIAVAVIDLDRFKEVNDTLGHEQGDRLLAEVGNRLSEVLSEGDTISRMGGDEFGLVLSRVRSVADAEAVAGRIAQALHEPIHLDGVPIGVDASIGLALHPAHGSELGELIRRADIAMYAAKRTHSGYAVYSPALDPHTSDRLALASDLRRAIEAGALSVHYQPKVLVSERALAGVEALVRWSHPVRGMLPPGEFIALAENTGLMGPLTSHVLRTALAQVREWLDGGLEVAVAVNVAPRSLLDPRFPGEVADALAATDVPAHLLELEVTEDSMLEDPDLARETLKELGAMGVSIAIDDFGTGFSSLSQLKTLPVGTLKIDRSFVSGMCNDARDAFIVRAAVRLGHDLGMAIVAEGVEDESTFELLRELQCDAVQGYLIHRPADAAALAPWLSEVRKRAADGHPRPRIAGPAR
ncbi:MAG TPA: EAL domain-containing protein [Solirubrobacteraceae bacterium]|nr:EAL domain-containing protein [Solirubrobacteraceae bacterium]